MKQTIRILSIAVLTAAIVFGFAACPDGNNGGGGGNGNTNPTPVADDYTFGNLIQTENDVSKVTITAKNGKSPGGITIWYAGTNGTAYAKSTTIPQAVGTYAVTFDVAAATGWNAAAGLSAGTLTVNDSKTPGIDDYNIGNLSQTENAVSKVTITAKSGKSPGGITIWYEGTNGTTYTKSTNIPQGVGKYTVTFDVGAASGWNPAQGLSAGILTVNPAGNKTPVASNYTFDNRSQLAGDVTAVSITPGANASPGLVGNIQYEGTGGTIFTKSTTVPQAGGTYAVTFDVAAAEGWNAREGLSAGNLVVGYWKAISATNSIFGTTDINDVAYGGGKWVAVGEDGKMAYSDDGVAWIAISATNSTFGSSTINGVAYGGGKWVAVGRDGKMAYSDDGVAWTAISATNSTFVSSNSIRGVAYGGAAGSEKWVAVGYPGKMAYSADGVVWTAISATNSTFSSEVIYSVAYGGGRWVAVGSDGKMAYSDNGTTWTAVTTSTFGSSGIYGVAYGNGRWVAVGYYGKMAYSDDGVTWTAISETSAFGSSGSFSSYFIYGVAYGNGRWVAVGSYSSMAYSADGVAWTTAVTSGSDIIYGVAYGGGKWVAVGARGSMAYSYLVGE